ncbi:hypothetical protein KH5H1_04510 [Corallococcus caeni]|uniref:Uncharacterized protein n=1 Tax=Corallococcus caeni TaxID=3082388 RepID=A0ABQ6QXY4_9BACT|nr:hypothetical protein KH5H1_04510 [Corallococcus sp. KH5-1]GMU08173.1 hypothetical protein ASNO1_44260 [Corallococcus sp. NO1]
MRLTYDVTTWEAEQAFFQGKPFTGALFEERASGLLCSETFYVDGLRQGPDRTWHESGLLAEEVFYWRNCWHGTSRAWLADGTMIEDRVYLYGLCVVERRWSHSGLLKTDRRASPDDPAVVATLARRTADGDWPLIEW